MFISHISSLYHEDSRIGDLLVKPQRWCHHQWQHVTSPLAKNPSPCLQVIARICYALLLILPTLGAYTFGLFGVLIKNFQVQPAAASQILTPNRSQQILPVPIPDSQSLPEISEQTNTIECSKIPRSPPIEEPIQPQKPETLFKSFSSISNGQQDLTDLEIDIDKAIDVLDFTSPNLPLQNCPQLLHKEILRPAINWLIKNSTSLENKNDIGTCAVQALQHLRSYLEMMLNRMNLKYAINTCMATSLTCIATRASGKWLLEIPSLRQASQALQEKHHNHVSKKNNLRNQLTDVKHQINLSVLYEKSGFPTDLVNFYTSQKDSFKQEQKRLENLLDEMNKTDSLALNLADEEIEHLGIAATGTSFETTPENLFHCLMEAFEKSAKEAGLWLLLIPQHAMFFSTAAPWHFVDSQSGLSWFMPITKNPTTAEFCLALTIYFSLILQVNPLYLESKDIHKPLTYRLIEFKKS